MNLHKNLAFFIIIAGIFACNDNGFGDGIGRPTYTAITRLSQITIAEVYFSDTQPSKRFVILTNANDHDLNGLRLKSPFGELEIAETLQANSELKVSLESIDGIGLWGGELAVVDENNSIRAYLAWGSDPMRTGSALAAAAIVAGVTLPHVFIKASYPIPEGNAIVALSTNNGCAIVASSVAEITNITTCPESTPLIKITSFKPNTDESWVTLTNSGSSVIDLFGLNICHPTCSLITKDLLISPGDQAIITLGPNGIAPSALSLASPGEVAILAPGVDDTASATAILAYVNYGNASDTLLNAAIANGIWPNATTNVLYPRVDNEIILAVSDPNIGAVPWVPAANDSNATTPIGPTTDLWTSCSYVRPWRSSTRSDIVIHRIERATLADAENPHADRIYLINRSTNSYSLTDINLVLVSDGIENKLLLTDIGIAELAAGAELVIELTNTDTECETSYCLPAPALNEGSEIALFNGANLIQYIAFSNSLNQVTITRSYATQAISANLWPGAIGDYAGTTFNIDCAVNLPDVNTSINLDLMLDGTSPPDWN
ncbi:MAG: hypothetical protein JW841_00370 [Deltaproteobacteria bacterium]|nr:hypothetical protein [Deltaproteobacteria bacterium]